VIREEHDEEQSYKPTVKGRPQEAKGDHGGTEQQDDESTVRTQPLHSPLPFIGVTTHMCFAKKWLLLLLAASLADNPGQPLMATFDTMAWALAAPSPVSRTV